MTACRILSVAGIALVSALVSMAPGPVVAASSHLVRLQFVSCPSDGQIGPDDGPADLRPVPRLASLFANRLAYYEMSDGPGAVAPRGWHCFGLYGSNGASLIVTPEPHDATDLMAETAAPLSGPAVVVTLSLADTSGRFAVAMVEARLFPARKKFVERVIAEGISPAGDFPFGPYPADILERRSPTDVRFTTPANADGMGTRGQLARNGYPIHGEARITASGDALVTDVRLPPELGDLLPAILP